MIRLRWGGATALRVDDVNPCRLRIAVTLAARHDDEGLAPALQQERDRRVTAAIGLVALMSAKEPMECRTPLGLPRPRALPSRRRCPRMDGWQLGDDAWVAWLDDVPTRE